jgi:hypothetical protein
MSTGQEWRFERRRGTVGWWQARPCDLKAAGSENTFPSCCSYCWNWDLAKTSMNPSARAGRVQAVHRQCGAGRGSC